jgi:trimeric autotransporter adhesin
MFKNTIGHDNLADGGDALFSNVDGVDNIASGSFSLASNTSGSDNLASGVNALGTNTTGNQNLADGTNALENSTGSSNIGLGFQAGQNLTTGSNDVDIANLGKAGESKVMRLGTKGDQRKTFLAGVTGTTVSGTAQPVVVNAQGQLGTASAVSAATRTKAASVDTNLRAKVNCLQREVNELRAEAKRRH